MPNQQAGYDEPIPRREAGSSVLLFYLPASITMLMKNSIPWWRHRMETISALLAICVGNSPVPDEFTTQRPVTRGFDVYFDLRPNKRLSKQSWGRWFETQSRPLWRHRNDVIPCHVLERPDRYNHSHAKVLILHLISNKLLVCEKHEPTPLSQSTQHLPTWREPANCMGDFIYSV